MNKIDRTDTTPQAEGAKNLPSAEPSPGGRTMAGKRQGGEQSPPRGGKKQAPKPFTLETLQECAKRVGAPPLGDTLCARAAADEISSLKPQVAPPKDNQHKVKIRAAIRTLETAISERIEGEEKVIKYLLTRKEKTVGTTRMESIISRREAFLAELRQLQNAMTLARKFFVDEGIKPGTHSYLKIDGLGVAGSYYLLKIAWEENGQKPPSAAKTYKTIGNALLKVGVDVSDSAIRDAVKAAEKLGKSRRGAIE